jgi:hypothetical protein
MYETELLGQYEPVTGSYVVQDVYKLVKDADVKAKKPVLMIKTANGYRELDDAFFKITRTFKYENEAVEKRKIKLLRVFIEGKFSVTLNPNETITPLEYTNGEPGPGGFYGLYSAYELHQLSNLSQPLVRLKGRFAHVNYEGKRCYNVEIYNAILTQDFPGAFFVTPIAESTYNFVATDATIEPITH